MFQVRLSKKSDLCFGVKRILDIVFVFTLAFACTTDLSAQVGRDTALWEWSVDASHHEPIVQVESNGGVGTGIVIRVDRNKPVADGFEGWCLTAWHVVSGDDGGRNIRVEYRNGRSAKNCKVIAHDEASDVALLWVWVPKTVTAAAVASHPVVATQAIEFAGLGGGSPLHCCLRHFAAVASAPTNENIIYADVPLLPGDSGGPVFNSSFEVTGIVSGGWFWWDGGVTNPTGDPVRVTWPARACNTKAILKVIAEAGFQVEQVASK